MNDASGPLIFIATNRLKSGALNAERRRVPGLTDFLQRSEPQLLAFNEYVDAARGEVAVVQVHPDGRSMEVHMETVAERAAGAYAETLEATTSVQVFGRPSAKVLEMLRAQAGTGVRIDSFPEHLGGFTRLAP